MSVPATMMITFARIERRGGRIMRVSSGGSGGLHDRGDLRLMAVDLIALAVLLHPRRDRIQPPGRITPPGLEHGLDRGVGVYADAGCAGEARELADHF